MFHRQSVQNLKQFLGKEEPTHELHPFRRGFTLKVCFAICTCIVVPDLLNMADGGRSMLQTILGKQLSQCVLQS